MNNNNYLQEIENILKSISDHIHLTPLDYSTTFSKMSGNEVYLKLENLQKTGAFKIRGALNKISKLSNEEKEKGVITASAGNHGQAIALAASIQGMKSVVVVPEDTAIVKIQAIKGYGGEVIEFGLTYDDAFMKAKKISNEKGLILVHAFNDEEIIKGQATIGLEILEQLPEAEYVFCPIGGGGLISGIASYCKLKNPDIKIIGVQSENAPSMHESFHKKEITLVPLKETICDGIAVKTPGNITFKMIKQHVDDVVVVSDEEVANTILLLLERAKLFVEGAGAASLAAILNNKVDISKKRVIAILSGGNLTPNLLDRIIHKGLIKGGRLLKIRTIMDDIPGELLKVLDIIARKKGNILSIIHNRERLEISFKKTEVIIEIETRNHEHIKKILEALTKSYQIEVMAY